MLETSGGRTGPRVSVPEGDSKILQVGRALAAEDRRHVERAPCDGASARSGPADDAVRAVHWVLARDRGGPRAPGPAPRVDLRGPLRLGPRRTRDPGRLDRSRTRRATAWRAEPDVRDHRPGLRRREGLLAHHLDRSSEAGLQSN